MRRTQTSLSYYSNHSDSLETFIPDMNGSLSKSQAQYFSVHRGSLTLKDDLESYIESQNEVILESEQICDSEPFNEKIDG